MPAAPRCRPRLADYRSLGVDLTTANPPWGRVLGTNCTLRGRGERRERKAQGEPRHGVSFLLPITSGSSSATTCASFITASNAIGELWFLPAGPPCAQRVPEPHGPCLPEGLPTRQHPRMLSASFRQGAGEAPGFGSGCPGLSGQRCPAGLGYSPRGPTGGRDGACLHRHVGCRGVLQPAHCHGANRPAHTASWRM